MARAIQPAYLGNDKLGYVYFDAIIQREVNLSATVPQYPTEKGRYFSDGVLRRPRTLSVTAFISDTPVTWRNRLPNDYLASRFEEEIHLLQNLYFSGQLMRFFSGGRIYENMAIEKISIPEVPDMKNASEVKLTLQQVEMVGSDTVEIDDYGRNGLTNTVGGTVWVATDYSTWVWEEGVARSGGMSLLNRRDEYK